MKKYSTFLKAPGSEPHHQMQSHVISRLLIDEVLPLCREVVGLFFFSLSQQASFLLKIEIKRLQLHILSLHVDYKIIYDFNSFMNYKKMAKKKDILILQSNQDCLPKVENFKFYINCRINFGNVKVLFLYICVCSLLQ